MCVCPLKYCAWHDKWYYKMWLSYKLIFIDKAQWCHKIVCPCSSCTLRHVVTQAVFGIWSKIDVPSTSMSRHSDRLALLDSKHILQVLRQLWIMLMLLTTCCPTKWMESETLTTESNSNWRHYHSVYRILIKMITVSVCHVLMFFDIHSVERWFNWQFIWNVLVHE